MMLQWFWEDLCEATPWELIKMGWYFVGLCLCVWKMCRDYGKE